MVSVLPREKISFSELPKLNPAWVRPMLLAAIAVHGVLIFAPLPGSEPKGKPAQDKEAPVKISKISTAGKTAKVSAKPKVETPKIANVPKVNNPSSQPSPVVQKQEPKPVEKQQEPAKQEPNKTETQTTQNQQKTVDSKTDNKSDDANLDNVQTPFSDFPHYNPSTPDCFGKGLGESCRIVTQPLASLSSYFEKEVPAKKYTLGTPELFDGGKVFEVSKGNMTLYLSLLEDGASTVYVLTNNKVKSLADLKGAAVVPDEVLQAVGAIAEESATDEDFSDPSFFYDKLTQTDTDGSQIAGETKGIVYSINKAKGSAPDAVLSQLKSQLTGIEFSVAPTPSYGGGNLYQMKKGNFTGYLNLVPSKDGSSTNVVVWAKNPAS